MTQVIQTCFDVTDGRISRLTTCYNLAGRVRQVLS